MKALNLGCGSRFCAGWENIDFVSSSPAVRAHDLRRGIPYGAESLDVVYHSHVLEHFPRSSALGFLRECCRVLKRGGVIRVAVPDLEAIARGYLDALEKASNNQPGWDANYDWMLLEMYDQTVRERSCGAMADYFCQDPIPNWDFVFARLGVQAVTLREAAQRGDISPSNSTPRRAWRYVLRNPSRVMRHKFVRILLGKEMAEAMKAATFRDSGEIHFWMYDAYSLARVLQNAGFVNPRRCAAEESQIPDWSKFNLDTEPDGSVYKPDSLFMEAVKP